MKPNGFYLNGRFYLPEHFKGLTINEGDIVEPVFTTTNVYNMLFMLRVDLEKIIITPHNKTREDIAKAMRKRLFKEKDEITRGSAETMQQ